MQGRMTPTYSTTTCVSGGLQPSLEGQITGSRENQVEYSIFLLFEKIVSSPNC